MPQTSEFEVVPSETPHANHANERPERHTAPVVIQLQDHKAPGGGPRANKQVKWVSLSEVTKKEEYAEHQFLARVRYPEAINLQYFASGSSGLIIEGLQLLVLEHNGWVDPDSESVPPAVYPPIDQPCTVEAERDKLLADEETTYAVALKEARTEAAKAAAEATHTKAVEKIEANCKRDRTRRTAARPEACCFWDAVSQEEVVLMFRSLQLMRGKLLDSLLETKTD